MSYFNSIKVQLKQKIANELKVKIFEFQFHKGTIKTTKTFKSKIMANENFNSIKVQLKQSLLAFDFFINKFQFHKGTIKTV